MPPAPPVGFLEYRERIVHAIMVASSTAGLIAYVPAVYVAHQYQQPSVIIVDTLAYLTVVILAIARHRVPYLVRAWALPTVTFVLGVFLTTRYGPRLGGWTWLAASPILAAVLLGLRAAGWTLAGVFTALVAMGIAQVAGVLDWTTPGPQPTTAWIISSTSSLFLTAILALSVGYMLQSLRAETEVRQAVEEERARLALAVQQSPDPVAIVERDGPVVFINPAFAAMTGWSEREVVGRPLDVNTTFGQPPDTLPDLVRALAHGVTWQGVVTGARRDGSPFEAEAGVIPLRDGEGVVTHQVLSLRDVTREHTLGRQLQQAQKLEALGTLAGGIAHDFNNLLMPILANTEQLLEELPEDAPARGQLGDVVLSARRARELVHGILTFSRKRESVREPLCVEQMAREVVRLLRPSIPEGIEVRVVGSTRLPAVLGHRGELNQVIMNLATNALDAMQGRPQGVLEITAEVVSEASDGRLAARNLAGEWVRLQVRDTGVGMAPEVLERVFDPFFTTKPAGHGTGLGLATAHGIVTILGGQIVATSTAGQGSTFAVYLRPTTVGGTSGARTVPPTAPRRRAVLLVDDEPAVLRATERLIKWLGHHVVAFSSPHAALTLLRARTHEFDLLFTDLTMPGMSGVELAREARTVVPGLTVVLASGYLDQAAHDAASAAGVRHMIGKPFSLEELEESIGRALGGNA